MSCQRTPLRPGTVAEVDLVEFSFADAGSEPARWVMTPYFEELYAHHWFEKLL